MSEFIIVFRESLEAALIVGIVLSYLKKIEKQEFFKFAYLGLILGVLGSVMGAVIFHQVLGGFTGVSEQLFEGITMLVGAALIMYLIVWMAHKKDTNALIKNQVGRAIDSNKGTGVLFLVFIAILREGIETTLFLNAVASGQNEGFLLFALLGLLVGVLVGYGVYLGLKGMNLRYLFNISSTLLILFAAGLFAHSIHEFQEAGIIPTFVEHIWDINHIVDENGVAGGFMKSLFGYNGNPSLLEVFMYSFSLVGMVVIYNKKKLSTQTI